MIANKDFIIVHTISEKTIIHGEASQVSKSETWLLKKYLGNDEHVTIPDGITSIGPDAFKACTNMKSISIPDSVKTIGSASFWECIHLESVRIPKSVKSFGSYAFANCSALSAVVFEGDIPNSGWNIGLFRSAPNVTIYASKDSNVRNQAKYNNIPFVAI